MRSLRGRGLRLVNCVRGRAPGVSQRVQIYPAPACPSQSPELQKAQGGVSCVLVLCRVCCGESHVLVVCLACWWRVLRVGGVSCVLVLCLACWCCVWRVGGVSCVLVVCLACWCCVLRVGAVSGVWWRVLRVGGVSGVLVLFGKAGAFYIGCLRLIGGRTMVRPQSQVMSL